MVLCPDEVSVIGLSLTKADIGAKDPVTVTSSAPPELIVGMVAPAQLVMMVGVTARPESCVGSGW